VNFKLLIINVQDAICKTDHHLETPGLEKGHHIQRVLGSYSKAAPETWEVEHRWYPALMLIDRDPTGSIH
jgi:hypothetical protein